MRGCDHVIVPCIRLYGVVYQDCDIILCSYIVVEVEIIN